MSAGNESVTVSHFIAMKATRLYHITCEEAFHYLEAFFYQVVTRGPKRKVVVR